MYLVLFIYSSTLYALSKYFLTAYSVSGVVLDSGDKKITKSS